uniref:Ovule protein n=1 Tax=Heterorhabditis bacteriophora TaxID=37862 RepID=A0A1I7XPE4_HETBA
MKNIGKAPSVDSNVSYGLSANGNVKSSANDETSCSYFGYGGRDLEAGYEGLQRKEVQEHQ